MRNRIIVIVIAVIVLAVGFVMFSGYAGVLSMPGAGATPTMAVVQAKSASEVVGAEGAVLPAQRATLAFKTGGRVVEILVREGDAVKAGALLARLDDAMLKAQVAQAEAAYTAARTQLARLQAANAAQIQIASAQLSRLKAGPTREELAVAMARAQEADTALAQAQDSYDRLSWIGGPTEVQLRAARDRAGAANRTAQLELLRVQAGARPEDIAVAQAQLDLAQGEAGKAEIRAAQAQAEQAKAALELAKAAAQDALLTAPFDGTTAMISVNVGQVVALGAPAIVFGNLAKLEIETKDLAEADIAKVTVGQRVNVKVDAFTGRTFQGKVSRVAPIANDYRGDKVYKVTIELQEGAEAGLRWGMTANVEIQLNR
jgi:HlyD family secretion protein